MKNLSLKSKITFAFLALVVILTTSISYFTISFFANQIKRDIANSQFVLVSSLAGEFDDKLSRTHNIILSLSGMITQGLVRNPNKATEFLRGRKEALSIFDNGLFLLDLSGRIIAETNVTPARIGKDLSFRDYFQVTSGTRSPYISNPYQSSQSSHDPTVMFTAPVYDGNGQMIAIVGGALSLLKDNLFEKLNSIRIGKTGYMYLYSTDRTMVMHPDKNRIMERDYPVGVNKLLNMAVEGFEGSGETVNSRGLHLISSFKRLKSKNWILVANYPVSEAYGPIASAKKTLLIAILVITVCILFFGRVIVNYFMSSLSLFTKHIEQLPQKNGEEKFFRTTSADEIGKMAGAFNKMVLDLETEKTALMSEKERLAVTLRSIGDGVITTDTEGRVFLMNKIAEALTGWTQEEAVGMRLFDVFHIIDEKDGGRRETPVERVIRNGATVELENHTVLIARDGTKRIIADSSAPIRDWESKIIGVVLVFRDVTEKHKMEEELVKAQKMESLGLLAGGIAHDFNNLLTAILGNISLTITVPMPREEMVKRLEDAEKASIRARDLSYQLLTFSKGGAPIKRTTSIIDLIKDSSNFILRGSNVSPEYIFPDDLWPAEVDEGQISQVINNLIINSKQAMPNGGTVRIEAANLVVGSDSTLDLQPGRYVRISVKDNGPGIPREHISRIFDPFFTTKMEGSGLGLCISYSIIKRHDGHITVESKPDAGTLFHIYLPASAQEITQARGREYKLGRGKGRILVMDDEELLRDLASGMLKALGYDCEVAKDGVETLEAYRKAMESGHPFDAVILDMTIPGGTGGRETIVKLKEIDASVRAVVTSGYSTDPVMSDYKQHGFMGALIKPYTVQDLSQAVDAIFNAH